MTKFDTGNLDDNSPQKHDQIISQLNKSIQQMFRETTSKDRRRISVSAAS